MKSKFSKIVAAALVTSFAMATALPLAGCISGKSTDYSQEILKVNLDDLGRLTWRPGTEVVCNIGYETSTDTAISFTTSNALTPNRNTTAVLPDGESYGLGDLKPAWSALADKLKLDLKDEYVAAKSDASISELISDVNDDKLYVDGNGNLVSDKGHCLWDYDIITGSCSAIQAMQNNSKESKFLDLSLYLDYMPNYKAFLNDNPLVYLSLTTDTKTGAMYYAPYFDGNDDVEKYTMIQRSWARKLLDEADLSKPSISYKEQAEIKQSGEGTRASSKSGVDGDEITIDGTKPYVTSFMGKTGNWQIDVINAQAQSPLDRDVRRTEKLTVNYDKALAAATTENEALYEAIKDAAGGTAYTGNSGNIVDLQNFAIEQTGGEVTGAQLLKILQEYIDVTYLNRAGESFYKQDGLKRSDVFCGLTAAWDVDLLTALSRCVVTCRNLLEDSVSGMQSDGDIFAFGGRSSFTQRIADMYAFAGELYGVRGLESRYEFTYINSEGKVCDARLDPAAWDAMDKMSAFATEGLLYTGDAAGTDRSVYLDDQSKPGPIFFLEHDYVQTQTLYQMRTEEGVDLGRFLIPEDYDFAPIITAVSKWNDGADNLKIMRFTESWRSVKNTGFCIPYQSVSNNPERLSAVLAIIDFLFSKDGQILMSYGPISENGNVDPNGWWYAEQLPEDDPDADLTDVEKFRKISDAAYLGGTAQYESRDGSCFVYEGKVYRGKDYGGRSIPIMTDDSLNCFKGKAFGAAESKIPASYTLNYTNYARKVIGSALPIGNKDQGFEFQCTSRCGLEGVEIVDAAINKAGIIKHPYQQVENDENNLWYVIMPTLLPLSDEASATLKEDEGQKTIDGLFGNSSSIARNAFVRVMYNGYGKGKLDGSATPIPGAADGEGGIVSVLEGLGLANRVSFVDEAWQRLYQFYTDEIKAKM